MSESENPNWSEEVKTHYHTPPGTFTKDADSIVETLLKGADNDPLLALHRLMFYINRAGDNLSNAKQVKLAKKKLEIIVNN